MNEKFVNSENADTNNGIEVSILIIKSIQEFMFFFSIMFILNYVKKKVNIRVNNKRQIEYYIVIALIVLNIIINTIKVIFLLKKLLKNQCVL